MFTEEEIDSIQIIGESKCGNIYLQEILKFFYRKQGNLYDYILTLPIQDLENISRCYDDDDDDWKEICVFIAITAYSIEQSQYGDQIKATLDELMEISISFCTLCHLAFCEKRKIIKVVDESYFFDPNSVLQITKL